MAAKKKIVKEPATPPAPKSNYLVGKTVYAQPKQIMELQQFCMLNYKFYFQPSELQLMWQGYEEANGGAPIQITEDGMQYFWKWVTQT